MAGEKRLEQSELVAVGLVSDSGTKVAEQDVASTNDGMSSNSTSSISSSGDATSSITAVADQEPVPEQGHNGNFTHSDDQGFLNRGDGTHAGIQSEDGSLLYCLPGYDPHATGSIMGVDGQQPYFSSSGYMQHVVSYESEAIPGYSWDSTYAGDVTNVTTALSRNVKSAPSSDVSVKSNGSNSMKINNNFKSKFSNLPLDSVSGFFTASPNISKSIHQNQPQKSLNKLGSGNPLTGHVKGLNTFGKSSSYSNQYQALFARNGPSNCGPNNRVWAGSNKFKLREKSDSNGMFEGSSESKRGPRVNGGSKPSNEADSNDKLGFAVRKNQYNLEDFQIEYANAKFFVIKSFSEDDVHKCIKYDVWSSTSHGNKKLDAAFHDAESKANEINSKCPLFLFFSVNGSGQFVGLAEMIGQVDFNKNMDFWQSDKWKGFFPVRWHIIKDIPNRLLRHIILENNDNRDVTYTKDTQEIGLKQGLEMLKIFKSYSPKTSILDDFYFYEDREKSLKAKRGIKTTSPTENYKNNDFPQKHHLKAGEKKIEEKTAKAGNLSDPSTLINLTKKLSLNPNPSRSGATQNLREKSASSLTASDAC